ncbi:hypothetical protein SCHPADRAFT_1003074 [Schizopora paradoxa]|uniref:Uncharacterized protein n=1 Tax=Schizopora paradoxa TaxID=27342 RepID=A0A0H2QZW5_9AGAM|nr:hypothetical protein SCHPADRAFT_1003074 [Schizopora paradoxa]
MAEIRSESPTEMHESSDVFEFPSSASSSSSSPSKARRQTAIYPNLSGLNKPSKPFSRSAAKRESVMALGSIEYLQHYFTKSGIAAKQNPLKPNSGSRPAIGGGIHAPSKASLGSISEFHLPETPAMPSFIRPPFPQVEKTYETDPENLKPGVIRDLSAVSDVWSIESDVDKGKAPDRLTEKIDVLTTLQTTTKLIRSVRNYVVSLPDDTTGRGKKENFRASAFSAPVMARRVVSNPTDSPSSPDPLSRIRRFALEVLTVLRALEESARLPLSDDAYDAQSDHASVQGSGDNALSPPGGLSPARSPARSPAPSEDGATFGHAQQDASFAFSVMSVPGRSEAVHVWVDEDDISFSDFDDEKPAREIWDERLVLGSGWLYRRDITLEGLVKERDVVKKYLDTVDEVLFAGPRSDGKRGWQAEAEEDRERPKARGGRRSSHGGQISKSQSPNRSGSPNGVLGLEASLGDLSLSSMNTIEALNEIQEEDEGEGETLSVDDDHLPEWARRSTFDGDQLARAHSLLSNILPKASLPLLPTPYTSGDPQSRVQFLDALSSGQLLCVTYNTCVRRSRKPWGYINKDSIHDIAALEAHAAAEAEGGDAAAEKRTKGWTFRRTDNLRLWAAALKLRYLLPLVTPPTSSGIPTHADALKSVIAGSSTVSSSAATTPTASPAPTQTKFHIPPPNSAGLASSASAPTVAGSRRLEAAPGSVIFDAKVVARKDEGWDAMLEHVVFRWIGAVVDEERRDR